MAAPANSNEEIGIRPVRGEWASEWASEWVMSGRVGGVGWVGGCTALGTGAKGAGRRRSPWNVERHQRQGRLICVEGK